MNIWQTLLIEPLANGLIVSYRILASNMGLAIIGFSIFLRLVLYPLTRPYMQSMKKMKEVNPKLEKLKKKYKGDKVKFAQAQAELFRQKGISPGAGCIPYLLQIVVLIAFFNVFTRTLSADGDPVSRFNDLLYPIMQFKEGEILNTQFLHVNITQPDVIRLAGLPFPLPGPLLLLAAFVQLLSAKITAPYEEKQEKAARQTPGMTDDVQSAMQKSMVFTFPLMTIFIGMSFPSGLALYWLVFSLSQAFQQYSAQGWGGLTPWVKKLGLLKSAEKENNK